MSKKCGRVRQSQETKCCRLCNVDASLDLHPHGPICFSGFFLRRLDVIPPHRAGVSLEIGFIHLLEKRKCLDG